MYGGGGWHSGWILILKITKVVTTTKPCIPVAQINGLSGMTDRHSHALKIFIEILIAPNSTVVLLNINYKTQYINHYGDEETICSKYLLWEGGTFQYTQNLVRCLTMTT